MEVRIMKLTCKGLVIILSITFLLSGCSENKEQKSAFMNEHRDFLSSKYTDFSSTKTALEYAEKNKSNFVKWAACLKKVDYSKFIVLGQDGYPDIDVNFKYKPDVTFKAGDLIEVSGNIDKFIKGSDLDDSVWVLKNCRIENVTTKEDLAKQKEEKEEADAIAKAEAEKKKAEEDAITKAEAEKKKVEEDTRLKKEENSTIFIDSNTGEISESDSEDKGINDNEKNNNIISGLDAGNIKINLKNKYNLKFTGPAPLPNSKEYIDTGEYFDSTVGSLLCEVYAQNPLKISMVSFTVAKADADMAFTKNFLGFCATIPYNKAEPENAKNWVISNISKLKKGASINTKIGSANFKLSRGAGGYSLIIYADGVK